MADPNVDNEEQTKRGADNVAGAQICLETAWPVDVQRKKPAKEVAPRPGTAQRTAQLHPASSPSARVDKTSIDVIRRIHLRLGHASKLATQRTLGNAKLPYEKEDSARALSNFGCDAGLHQSREDATVAPHRSLLVGHAVQVDMFYPA